MQTLWSMAMTAKIITTAAGAVEFETHGHGTPVIVIHGSPGGIDAARAMSRFLPRDRFQTICVSRPGYLGTPLDTNDPSIDHESDLLAALLDRISVRCAGVLAWSGGGPAAYRFTVRHPNRVSAIVAIADTDASVEYSRSAHAELPNSTLIVMEQGTHLAFYAHPEASDVQEQARRWLQSMP